MARNMIISAALLAVFALFGTGLVALTHGATEERIAQNEREALLANLHALIAPESHDNDLFADHIQVADQQWLGTAKPIDVYRARHDGEPIAAVLAPTAPDGYGGDIHLMVAVLYDGTLAGVRVLKHQETPGLGDKIEAERSDWIHRFSGRSLSDPPPPLWKVHKDGGVFDQFTGATITPRAVVKAVHHTLVYFEAHRHDLFEEEHDDDAPSKNEDDHEEAKHDTQEHDHD